MGDKSTARETMKKAGVPTVPGSDGLVQVELLRHQICVFDVIATASNDLIPKCYFLKFSQQKRL